MAAFTQLHNPFTGKLEWGLQKEDYDYKQEVARAAYADMLHDDERNKKYFEGLKSTIANLRDAGKEVHVLDIGAGTGLLSMMAVSCGADTVTACEAFTPMANCAKRILEINGCDKKVKLIPKRSTEIVVGEDMERRANVLVTEVFDTELIGEGAIETFSHAMTHLLTEDAYIVPSEATIYAQIVSSNTMKKWNKLLPIHSYENPEKVIVEIPKSVNKCPGTAALHDIQMSEVNPKWFNILSEPTPVFWFDWSGRKKKITANEKTEKEITFSLNGSCDAVLMWWDLKMDQDGLINLSCAPFWAHPFTKGNKAAKSSDIPWRDHWMQAVYYLPQKVNVNKDDKLILTSYHDEYSLWFDLQPTSSSELVTKSRPVCDCGVHLMSRTRIGQINDSKRIKIHMKHLEENVNSDSVVLCLGDSCILAIAAAKLGARHVYVNESNIITKRFLNEMIKINNITDKITILDTSISNLTSDSSILPISLVVSEPFFETSLLPWHSLICWYLKHSALKLLNPQVKIFPKKMVIWAMAVEYRDLWKIRSPLNSCCGFTLKVFDKLIEEASDEADENVEPHPLWEYPAKCLSEPMPLMKFDLTNTIPNLPIINEGSMPVTGTGKINGLALWSTWYFSDDDRDCITTGPIKYTTINEEVDWDLHTRQGVFLFKEHLDVDSDFKLNVNYSLNFNPSEGTLKFDFILKQ